MIMKNFLYLIKITMTVSLVVNLGISFHAHAEDDLLSILGGGEAPEAKKANEPSVLSKVITSPTAEQNIFTQFFDKGEMEKALYQWPVAFDETEFGKSVTGRALYNYLLVRNGIRVTGLEGLLALEKPEAIAPEVLKLWKDSVSETDDAWRFVTVNNWQPKWTETFGVAAEIRVLSRRVYGADQVEAIKELVKKTQVDTRERAWLEWQLVLAMADGPDAGVAAKALAHLMKAPNNPVSTDLMTITAARLLYQNGFLDAAMKYYEKVPKSSDHWFEAQEEIGWAYIRKGEPQNAIAVTRSLMTPVFTSQIGPEAVFLRSLAQLKICDYPEVVGTLNTFRERYRERAKSLLQISENAETPVVKKFIERLKQKPLKLTELGGDARQLPRYITRDEVLAGNVAAERVLEAEGQKAGELYARSLSGGTAKVGFQAGLEQFRKSIEARVQLARDVTYGRVKALASEEVGEISQMLQKLHVVEVEILQQISVADRVKSATQTVTATEKKGTTGSQGRDRLWFPAENKEEWFDELANYRVDVKKGCETVRR
jgi:predicted negative regulator of RcsB-dependent stress response